LRYFDRDGTEDHDDKLLDIYIACMKLNGRVVVSERSADSCLTVLNTHVPRKTKEGQGDYTGLSIETKRGRPAFLRINFVLFP
jgi:hypothetical protein